LEGSLSRHEAQPSPPLLVVLQHPQASVLQAIPASITAAAAAAAGGLTLLDTEGPCCAALKDPLTSCCPAAATW
jgi:hypothetical protein